LVLGFTAFARSTALRQARSGRPGHGRPLPEPCFWSSPTSCQPPTLTR
jgi:hypothetical protein